MMTDGSALSMVYSEECSPERRLLSLCVQGARSDAQLATIRSIYDDLGCEGAARLAARNRSESIMAHSLADAGVIGWPWDEWHAEWGRRIDRMMTLLDQIAASAARLGIPVVALKNGAIARALHPCPACVPMGDLDLLVSRGDFARMHHVLAELGFRVVSGGARTSGPVEGLREGGTDYAVETAEGVIAVDLQWRAISGRWLRFDQEPAAERLIERSVAMPGTAARMLAATDNLIQVALHTAKHSYCRAPGFRLHLDVDRVVHGSTIDWEEVVHAVRGLRVGTAVFLSLSIPRGLFGTPIPDSVLAALDPGPVRRTLLYRWLRRVSVFDPDRPKFSRAGQLLFHLALSDDTASGCRTLLPSPDEMRARYAAGPGAKGLLIGYGQRVADVLWRYQQ